MRSKRDSDWMMYLCTTTFTFVKYVCHKTEGTTLDVMIPAQGEVLYIPFTIGKKPVHILRILRPYKIH